MNPKYINTNKNDTVKCMKQYMVIYDYEFLIIMAYSFKECIEKLADYVGDNSDLFRKAMTSLVEIKDMIDMFNHFSNYTINAVYEIGDTVYHDDGMKTYTYKENDDE